MTADTFRANLTRGDDNLPVRAVGFRKGHDDCLERAFVSLNIGHPSTGEFTLLLDPAEAQAIAGALLRAADYAEERVVEMTPRIWQQAK